MERVTLNNVTNMTNRSTSFDFRKAYAEEGDSFFEGLYKKSRDKFISWLMKKHSSIDRDLAKEIFQESMLILFTKIKNGQVQVVACSPETYLFGIGNYVLLNHLKTRKPYNKDFEEVNYKTSDEVELEWFVDPRVERVLDALQLLSPGCRSLIEDYYFNDLTIAEIQQKYEYASMEVARTRKYKCLNKLKNVLNV